MKAQYKIYLLVALFASSCIKKEAAVQADAGSAVTEITKPNSAFLQTQQLLKVAQMAKIDSGKYVALYGKKGVNTVVQSFYIDVYPVTNREFLEFVKVNPEWRKSQVKEIFADGNYLRTWENDTTLGVNVNDNAAVTNVSWFAANAYCEFVGKRLPTLDEWEYVAMASETEKDARTKKEFSQYLLSWYEQPNSFKKEVGKTYKNYWGLYDIHGLVWEWTSDFSSILMDGENRNAGSENKTLFCGSSSLNATDLMNYAAFMRYAFRGSVKANYAVQNLGFRCAKNIQ